MAVRIDNWKLIVGNPVGSLFEQLYIYKRSFCQDRLGTNIRKVEKKRAQRHSPICVSVIIDTHIHTHCCARSNEISIEFGQRGLVQPNYQPPAATRDIFCNTWDPSRTAAERCQAHAQTAEAGTDYPD
jgi:hypothetical protein